MSLTADNNLEQAFNKELKVAGLYKGIYVLCPDYLISEGYSDTETNKQPSHPQQALPNTPMVQTARGCSPESGGLGGRNE